MGRVTRGDAIVLALTALATVALDLVQAVILGLIVAGVPASRAIALFFAAVHRFLLELSEVPAGRDHLRHHGMLPDHPGHPAATVPPRNP
ncbi:hypothetical protein [Herbidospora solisilvae]|uniref:hypothetical protein n=1 Tax=Herbidospora solisilvae TaxID=2696284 RepID=UPI001F315A34|nr:hypothetical protein [Herbidospora solisilvae]